jgi:hypothetical protein
MLVLRSTGENSRRDGVTGNAAQIGRIGKSLITGCPADLIYNNLKGLDGTGKADGSPHAPVGVIPQQQARPEDQP